MQQVINNIERTKHQNELKGHSDIMDEELEPMYKKVRNKDGKYAVCEAFSPLRVFPRARTR